MKWEPAGVRRATNVLRAVIGSLLLATAVGKLLDVPGFVAVLGSYRVLSQGVLAPAALAVIGAEVLLGLWLLSGRRLAGAALASGGLHLAYSVWAAAALARGLALPNCGCFGVFLPRPLSRSTVVEDLGMAGASLALYGLSRRT